MNALVLCILDGLAEIPAMSADEAVAISRAAMARVQGLPVHKPAPPTLSAFLFVLHGLGREMWVQGEDEEAARYTLWRRLSEADRMALVQVDCINETAPFVAHTFREPAGLGLQA